MRKNVISYAPIHTAAGHVATRYAQMAGPHETMILPGFLLQRDGDSLKPHSTAGAVRPALIAMENKNRRHPKLTPSISTPYVFRDEEPVPSIEYFLASTGMMLNMLIAPGVEVKIGDSLESAGDGTLKVASDSSVAFAEALESVSATDSMAQIQVEVIQ